LCSRLPDVVTEEFSSRDSTTEWRCFRIALQVVATVGWVEVRVDILSAVRSLLHHPRARFRSIGLDFSHELQDKISRDIFSRVNEMAGLDRSTTVRVKACSLRDELAAKKSTQRNVASETETSRPNASSSVEALARAGLLPFAFTRSTQFSEVQARLNAARKLLAALIEKAINDWLKQVTLKSVAEKQLAAKEINRVLSSLGLSLACPHCSEHGKLYIHSSKNCFQYQHYLSGKQKYHGGKTQLQDIRVTLLPLD
jgi:hypothetical protein